MQIVKKSLSLVMFCVIGLILFYFIQRVFTPNFQTTGNANYSMAGFNNLENNSLDVVILGNSGSLYCVYPMEIYKDYQIRSYNISTANQTIELSQSLLKMVFERQKPSVVMLNIRSIFEKEKALPSTWRYATDNLPLSISKLRMATDFQEVEKNYGFISTVFPIVQFHDRWTELSGADFERAFSHIDSDFAYYSMGAYLDSSQKKSFITIEGMNGIAESMRERNYATYSYTTGDGIVKEGTYSQPLFDQKFSDYMINKIAEIKDLCEQNGSELVLFIPPTVTLPQSYSNRQFFFNGSYEVIHEIANKIGVKILDFMYECDCGVDFLTDTIDGGYHLNASGARKISAYIGKWLNENYDFDKKQVPLWNECLQKYNKMSEVLDMQMETNFSSYMKNLVDNKEHYEIYFTSSIEFMSSLNENDYKQFNALGLSLINDVKFADAYLAVIKLGDVEYEAVSPRQLRYQTTSGANGIPVKMISTGWYNGTTSSTTIGGYEYSPNLEGLNIVVVDKESGLVIDSVCFETRYEEKTAHRPDLYNLIRNYETKICLN